MQIREADERDLETVATIFARSLEDLLRRYRPDQLHLLPIDAATRVPFLSHLRRTGRVLVADDPEPVGFAAAVVRESVWFLSQLWILPDHHRGGIGTALLDEALAFGRDASAFCTVSSPHPAARLLYMRASMFPLWSNIEMTGGDEGDRPKRPDGVRELTERDQGWVDELDREVRGAARPEDHSYWREEQGIALALDRPAGPSGYVYVWPDGKVSPAAAKDPADVPALIQAARHAAAGPSTFIVPSTNWLALSELTRAGYVPIGAMNTYMGSRPLADGTRYLPTGALG